MTVPKLESFSYDGVVKGTESCTALTKLLMRLSQHTVSVPVNAIDATILCLSDIRRGDFVQDDGPVPCSCS